MKKSLRTGCIVVNRENKIALANEHLWGFPRGGVEDDEDFETAALRETVEEVGISDYSSIKELGVYERYPHGMDSNTLGAYPMEIHMFLLCTDYTGELNPTDEGVKEAKWFTYEEAVKKLTNDADRQFLVDNRDQLFNK